MSGLATSSIAYVIILFLYTQLVLSAPTNLLNRQATAVPDFVTKYGMSTVHVDPVRG